MLHQCAIARILNMGVRGCRFAVVGYRFYVLIKFIFNFHDPPCNGTHPVTCNCTRCGEKMTTNFIGSPFLLVKSNLKIFFGCVAKTQDAVN